MKQYLDLLNTILKTGIFKKDRTGTGTLSCFGDQMRFDLQKGFPAVTTKKLYMKGVIYELLWFLNGDTNIKYLNDHGVHIWDEWADENGDLGPVYGRQWREWGEQKRDQIERVLDQIKRYPDSRRMCISAWNVDCLNQMSLVPCHAFFQFYVGHNNKLSCKVTQRSADMFLGVPFNIASYALLTHMIAQQCGLDVGELIWSGGDCHIYNNHRKQIYLQLAREPYPLPTLYIKRKPDSISDYKYEDFELLNYKSHSKIEAPIAV